MKISNLQIAAFRGIRDSITLDLRAPLTVLYAPNGAGKTSVCAAAEWLLTGQLSDLGIGMGDVLNGIRCQFSDDGHPTRTVAELCASGQSRRLGRSSDGPFQGNLLEERRLEERDLLATVAPGLVGENVHGALANNVRRAWIKGTRFLAGESLALLVDSSEALGDKRKQIFADILGTRSLIDTSSKIERYCTEVRSRERELRGRKEELEGDIGKLTAKFGPEDSEALQAQLITALEGARDALRQFPPGLKPESLPEAVSADERIEAQLVTACGAVGALLDERQSALDGVEARWSTRIQLQEDAKTIPEAIEKAQEELDTARADAAQQQKVLQEAQERAEQLREQAGQWQEGLTYVRDVRTQLSQWLEGRSGAASTQASMRELCASVPEMGLESREIDRRRQAVEALLAESDTWRGLPQQILHLEEQQSSLMNDRQAFGDIQELRGEHDRTETVLNEKRSAYAAVAGAVDRIRQAVDSAMPALGQETRCPACGTDFHGPDRLAAALRAAMAGMPEAQRTLGTEVAKDEKALQALKQKVSAWEHVSGQLTDVQQRLRVAGQQRDAVLEAVAEPASEAVPVIDSRCREAGERRGGVGELRRDAAAHAGYSARNGPKWADIRAVGGI